MYIPAVMLGLGIGDALGMPFEAYGDMPRISESLKAWDGSKFVEGVFLHDHVPGNYLPAGSVTDDTQMAMALAQSLHSGSMPRPNGNRYDPRWVAEAYRGWYTSGEARGVGGTIRRSMEKLLTGFSWKVSGQHPSEHWKDWVGNGVSMRIAPLGVLYAYQLEKGLPHGLAEAVILDAGITHAHPDAIWSAWTIARAVSLACALHRPQSTFRGRGRYVFRGILEEMRTENPLGVPLNMTLRERFFAFEPYLEDRILPKDLPESMHRDDAVGISAMALYVLAMTSSFSEAVLTAVKLGGDCDTRGAIVGAMAGGLYGLHGIPEWMRQGVEYAGELLFLDGVLRGCAGHVEPRLLEDVTCAALRIEPVA